MGGHGLPNYDQEGLHVGARLKKQHTLNLNLSSFSNIWFLTLLTNHHLPGALLILIKLFLALRENLKIGVMIILHLLNFAKIVSYLMKITF